MILIDARNKRSKVVCATCKTYGYELSRKMFLGSEREVTAT